MMSEDYLKSSSVETITLTTKTLVKRKLVVFTIVGSVAFHLLVLWFISLVFYFDLQAKWSLYAMDGLFDEVPRRAEEAKMQEQLSRVLNLTTPGMYQFLYKHWHCFFIGIPLFTLLIGGILSLYRPVTIATLGLYHFISFGLTCCLVLYTILAVFISWLPVMPRSL